MTSFDKATEAVKLLVEALLEEPTALVLDLIEAEPDAILTVLKVDDCDRGKLIGSDASHIRATRFIAATIGKRLGGEWNFRADLPAPPRNRGPRPPDARRPDKAPHEKPTRVVLERILEACLASPASINAKPGALPGDFVFRIVPANQADSHDLFAEEPFDNRTLTLVDALGTLVRAIGRRQGVNYRVEVA